MSLSLGLDARDDYKHGYGCNVYGCAGVFGNSLSSGRPTWAVFADNLTDTSTAGVITDQTLLPTVDDFKYSVATDNRWHQHVLTYNGKNSPLPTLQYFIDGNEMVGNSRLEIGNFTQSTP